MAPMKAKQVQRVAAGKFAKATSAALKRPAAAIEEAETEEAEVEESVAKKVKLAKKPAAALDNDVASTKKAAKTKKGKQAVEEEAKAQEDNVIEARQKELKAMAVVDLKDLLKNLGLATGLKGEMVEKVLAHEAKGREAARALESKRRDVLAKKKEDMSAKSIPELKELCEARGVKLGGSKEERVERLIAHAQENGEIEEALAAIAREARRAELASMDKGDLWKLCDTAGVDPLVKEVMVERIISHEGAVK